MGRRGGARRLLAVVALVGVAVGLLARPAVAAPPGRLVIDNNSNYFSNETLEQHFRAKLSEPMVKHLGESTDAVWLFMLSTSLKSGSSYCFAGIGLTEAPPKGRNARIPDVISYGASRSKTQGAMSDAQLNACMSDALDAATDQFVKQPLETRLQNIERTREKGTRKWEAASPTTAQLYSSGLSDAGSNAIFGAIPVSFRGAFDFRKLQWVVMSSNFRFGEQVVCFSIAGVSARAPTDRNPRLPGFRHFVTWEMTPDESRAAGAEHTCTDGISLDAVNDALRESWDDKGLLQDFKWAQEAGVGVVANYRGAGAPSAAARDLQQFRRSLKVGSESHCGLVVEVRQPIAKIQTMIGERWLKTAQLYPKGAQDCRFVNGTYQDPD
ncbi:MAG: hypothetical protein ABUL60_04855 [Myxococcales bacterium]